MNTRATTAIVVTLATLVVVMALAVGVLVVRSVRQGDRLEAVVSQIQSERQRNARRACEDQNQQHRDAVRSLRRLVPNGPVPTQAEAERRDRMIEIFASAIARERDCAKIVKQQVKGKTP